MLQQEIMEQLVQAEWGPGYNFPNFLINYPIDTRMSVYRTETEWAILLETFLFNDDGVRAHECCQTMQFRYGSSLPEPPGIIYPQLYVTGDGPTGPLFDPMDDTFISPTATDMTIRGKVVPITTSPAQYTAAGIEIEFSSIDTESWTKFTAAGINLGQPPRIQGYELLRLIAPKYRDLFFATDAEIVKLIGKPMPLLLRLDEWRHPDATLREGVADSESFRMIAEVIAKNDPSLYRPTVPPNTHWRNWPMAGTIV